MTYLYCGWAKVGVVVFTSLLYLTWAIDFVTSIPAIIFSITFKPVENTFFVIAFESIIFPCTFCKIETVQFIKDNNLRYTVPYL